MAKIQQNWKEKKYCRIKTDPFKEGAHTLHGDHCIRIIENNFAKISKIGQQIVNRQKCALILANLRFPPKIGPFGTPSDVH